MTSQKKGSWNWAAFFVGEFWMFHRKMYLITLLFSILHLLYPFLCRLMTVFSINNGYVETLCAIYPLFLLIVPGRYGNYLYLWHTNRQVAKGKEQKNGKHGFLLTTIFIVSFVFIYVQLMALISTLFPVA